MINDPNSSAVLDEEETAVVQPQLVEQAPDGEPQIERRRYNVLHALVLSFFSANLYYDVAHRWKGVGIWYLALVTLLAWLPLMVTMHFAMDMFLEEEAPKIIEQIPSVELANGSLSVDVEQPYTIDDPDTGKPLLVIDTTGKHTSLDSVEARALLTRTKFIARNDTGRTQSFDLSDVDDFKLDASLVQQWAGTFAKTLEIAVFAVCGASNWFYRFCQVLGLSIVAAMATKPGTIRFSGLMRLAAVALTPTIAVCTVAMLCNVPTKFWYWWPFCIGLMLAYYYFAVSSRRKLETVPVKA